MVDAANIAIRHHPKWRAEFERLEPRLGRSKTIVAIARKLLVVVWHVLTKGVVDRHAHPESVARSLFNHVYHRIGVKNLPEGVTAKQYVRHHLDKLGVGRDLKKVKWGSKYIVLPPSTLPG